MACPSLQTIIDDISGNSEKSPYEHAVVMSTAAFSLGASGGLGLFAVLGRKFPCVLHRGLAIPLAFGGLAAVGTYLMATDNLPQDLSKVKFIKLKT